jgi:hypothetical protein
MQLYLRDHRDLGENPSFNNRELFLGITKSIFCGANSCEIIETDVRIID